MIAVYKYPANTIVQMPKGAIILHCGAQGGRIQIWAEVETDAELEERRFVIYSTGTEIRNPKIAFHRGTVIVEDGTYVFHVYEDMGVTDEQK